MKTVAILIIIINAALCEVFLPTVTIPLGKIEGFLDKTVKGRTYNAFEGIPYARPPVGKHRFKEPVPAKPWLGIWHAKTIFKCMQYNHYNLPGHDMLVGDEDCLYINVYTPNLNPTEKLDVLVYIHGGAFMFNYGALQGPQILLDRNIVFVSLNYRLGPFGFLSTENDLIPGNNGLKDQMLALKWVKDNVEYFGGNPNSITISGMSAGGASVHFHYIMPGSQGLFHRGISQSGSVLNSWVLVEHPLEKTKKLSSIIGCPTDDTKQMVECLMKKPGRQIIDAVKHFQPWLYNPFSPFGPVVDIWAADPVLPDHPYNLLKNKKVQDVPWIISHTSSEGLYPASEFYFDDRLEYINTKWNEVMPYILHYNDVVDPKLLDTVSQQIRKEYFQDKTVTKTTYLILVKLLGDRLFVADIEKAARLHSAAIKSPVYTYHFDYRGAHSTSEFKTGHNENIGVSHADDTWYVLKTDVDTLSTEEDRKMSKILVDMFISYVKSGKPNIVDDWKPLPKEITKPWIQLHISDPQNLYMEEKMELGNRKFWESLPLKENENLGKVKEEL